MATENPLQEVKASLPANLSDDIFEAVKSSQSYLPRLQLLTSNSEVCKAGDFPINHYARVLDSSNRNLGEKVDILICSWRPMALETTVDGNVITVFDPQIIDGKTTGEFARIQKKASAAGMNGCMCGHQYLVWVPSAKEFMTFYMASKTALKASPQVKALMDKPGTLASQKIVKGDFTWYGPTCQPCSTPFEMPEKDALKKEIEKFLSPPKPEVEKVTEEKKEGETARER